MIEIFTYREDTDTVIERLFDQFETAELVVYNEESEESKIIPDQKYADYMSRSDVIAINFRDEDLDITLDTINESLAISGTIRAKRSLRKMVKANDGLTIQDDDTKNNTAGPT